MYFRKLADAKSAEAFSFHPGGLDVLFVDGGVRFLSEQIEIQTYASMITRAGYEVIDHKF